MCCCVQMIINTALPMNNMDFLNFSYPLSLSLLSVLVSVCFFLIFYRSKASGASSRLPPGKMGWPILGETIEYFKLCYTGNPEKFIIDRMRNHSDKVFKTSLLTEKIVVFCGAEGRKFLFSNENQIVTAWWPKSLKRVIFPSGLGSSPEDETRKLRATLPPFLKPEALRAYVPIMDSLAKKHLETEWAPTKQLKAFDAVKQYTFSLACRIFISVEDPKRVSEFESPFKFLNAGIVALPFDIPGTAFNRAVKAANVMRKELMKMMKQRKIDMGQGRAKEGQDILSHLLTAKDENGEPLMNELCIADKIISLLLGGHDSASSAITFFLKYLAEFPDICDAVYHEQEEIGASKAPGELLNWSDIQKMKYSWCVASEVMRLTPAAMGGFREALTDFSYAGHFIPKGWKMLWNVYSTNRNPTYFPEPEKFDPSRFEGEGPPPFAFTPFGGGPRMCPGKEYARLEILVFMHNVVRKFKWQIVDPHEKITFTTGAIPVNGFPIRIYPRVQQTEGI